MALEQTPATPDVWRYVPKTNPSSGKLMNLRVELTDITGDSKTYNHDRMNFGGYEILEPGTRFRVVSKLATNQFEPCSTGGGSLKNIDDYVLIEFVDPDGKIKNAIMLMPPGGSEIFPPDRRAGNRSRENPLSDERAREIIDASEGIAERIRMFIFDRTGFGKRFFSGVFRKGDDQYTVKELIRLAREKIASEELNSSVQ